VSQRLRLLGIDPASDWFPIHPGASAPARRYPPELWAQAAQQLALGHRCPVVFVGSAQETELIASIRAGMATPSLALCGELDLGGLAACIALAPVLLCNNSRPAHIAAATGTPVVDLYALTNPQHTPWQVPHSVLFHDVPCRFCYRSVCPQGHHACLRQVDPGIVAAAATELLAARAAGYPSSPYTRTVPEMLNNPAPYRAAAMA
jgi:ADP-heptose:LPS heptosyltransferase